MSSKAPKTYLRILNWDQYQHYKDRDPPWIKLHRQTLTSEMWVSVDDASRVLAVASMLLAAETGNLIPNNPDFLKRRCWLRQEPDFSQLISCGFIEIIEHIPETASNMLASARPETEKRREEKKEGARAPKNVLGKEKVNGMADGPINPWERARLALALKGIQHMDNTPQDFERWLAGNEITPDQARKAGAAL